MDKILEELNNTLSSITDKNREECFNKLKEQRCGCNYPTVDEFLKHNNMEYFKGTKGRYLKPKNFFQKSQNQYKKGIPPPKNFFQFLLIQNYRGIPLP